jgi:hypothetical protein
VTGSNLVLPVHLAFVVLLGIATLILLFGTQAATSDCCLPVAIFGVFTLGELLAVLIAIAIAGVTTRHSPLVIVDVLIVVPLAAIVSLSASPGDGSASAFPLVALALLIVGVASAAAAARVVRYQPIERIILAGTLILLAAFASAVPSAIIGPVLVLAVLFWPQLEALGTRFRGRPGSPSRAAGGGVGADAAAGGTAGSPERPAGPVLGRRGPPDAAAILGSRRVPPGGSTGVGSTGAEPVEVAPSELIPPGPPDGPS